jgi:hypothetical protein
MVKVMYPLILTIFFVASYAESRLPQSNLRRSDVAFCFTYVGSYIYPSYKVRMGILAKFRPGYILGHSFANASGHPGPN